MEKITEQKEITLLTKYSVSILTKKFIEIEGKEYQIGENHRVAYVNSAKDREKLKNEQPENVVTAVMSIWGSEPLIKDKKPKNNQ